jgi:hemerythrin
LLEQIRETTSRAQLSEDGEMRSLLSFLRGWYLNHIQEFDQLYGKWLNERGIA